MIDLEREREHWRRTDGVPGFPYSSHWHAISGFAASVVLRNPRGRMNEWQEALGRSVAEHGLVIPRNALDAIANACLERMRHLE